MWARSNGYINGYEDGTFKPARGVSRVEALKMLYLASGGVPTDPGTATSFPDVRSDAWYAPFIRRAEADDIVHGYRDGRFRPDNTVTRVELLKIATRLNRLNHYSASGAPRFSDTPLGRWFVPYVNLAVTTGLVDAPGSTFSPDEAMAREEVAELLFRLRKALDAGQLDVFPAPFVRDGKLLVHVRAQGYASFYSDSLEGSGTANGEKYDPKALTCAHPSLPFGTLVTVSNPDTEKSVVCRVNDRGPYAKSRILDLSRASFESIERASAGVTRVNWEADVDLGA